MSVGKFIFANLWMSQKNAEFYGKAGNGSFSFSFVSLNTSCSHEEFLHIAKKINKRILSQNFNGFPKYFSQWKIIIIKTRLIFDRLKIREISFSFSIICLGLNERKSFNYITILHRKDLSLFFKAKLCSFQKDYYWRKQVKGEEKNLILKRK
jgi:hypothetical protein